ncbi:YqzH family protein [Sutcliffiella halmapala]|uniref:YqzH family protein n=1 Tax=Sutcliffiella halmapala TaxID=79882 RepID=UPI000994E700|nr:YqzH family protein [Sutcliffiella halmapala]
MEKKLLKKMIRNGFIQYRHDPESVPLSDDDYERLVGEVAEKLNEDTTAEVFEVINDVVYEYLSQ